MGKDKYVGQTRLIRWCDVHKLTGICRSHAHALAAKGEFPKPVKLGDRASAWVESEIERWIESRIDISRGGFNE